MVGGPSIELHDVADAEAFVAASARRLLDKHAIPMGYHDREDLEAHGLEIMLTLARTYRPAHARKGWPTFSSYAGDMLPKRMLDEMRKRGTRGTDPHTGRRVWRPRVVESLDSLMDSPDWDERGVAQMGCFERPRLAA